MNTYHDQYDTKAVSTTPQNNHAIGCMDNSVMPEPSSTTNQFLMSFMSPI